MSADTVFEVGETVKLKSDGHLMTVVSVAEDSITCDWSVRGDVKSKSFPVAALKKAVSDGPDGGANLLEQITMVAMARLETERNPQNISAESEPKSLEHHPPDGSVADAAQVVEVEPKCLS